jgi:hypothetical protein
MGFMEYIVELVDGEKFRLEQFYYVILSWCTMLETTSGTCYSILQINEDKLLKSKVRS